MVAHPVISPLRRAGLRLLPWLAAAAASGCFHHAPPPEAASVITDANIVAILTAANEADMSYAQLAEGRSASSSIKQFAMTMLTDHGKVNQAVADLVRTGITPVQNTTSLNVRDDAAAKHDQLQPLKGPAFDLAYIDNEVDYHRRLAAVIQNSLIPAAKQPELRAVLTAVSQAVATHLADAERIKAALEK